MIIGTKYQGDYVDDIPMIYRIIDIHSENKIILRDQNGNEITRTKKQIDDMVQLEPDAIMNMMVVERSDEMPDVYVCLHNTEVYKVSKMPQAIIRQDIYSAAKNFMLSPGQSIFVGDVLYTQFVKENEIADFFDIKDIKHTNTVSLYVDDNTDIILELAGKKSAVFDNTLSDIKEAYQKQAGQFADNVHGYCSTLVEFLQDNTIIDVFRSIFGIITVDFAIDLGDNVSEDGEVTLTSKQIEALADTFKTSIMNVRCIRYAQDIDISDVKNTTHAIISDIMDVIYLVYYIIVDDGKYYDKDDIELINMMRRRQ